MKKVLWLSRHNMTDDQLRDLNRIYGPSIEITSYTETVWSVEDLRPLINENDVIAVVLPLDKLCELLNIAGDKPVIRSVAERHLVFSSDNDPICSAVEPSVIFKHVRWQQILKLNLETVDL